MSENVSTLRWFIGEFLKTEHFKNGITMILVLTYCWMMANALTTSNEFSLLVGMVLGFYFKKDDPK